jgi:hypothetical protein
VKRERNPISVDTEQALDKNYGLFYVYKVLVKLKIEGNFLGFFFFFFSWW